MSDNRLAKVLAAAAVAGGLACLMAAPASAQSLTDRFKGLFGGKSDHSGLILSSATAFTGGRSGRVDFMRDVLATPWGEDWPIVQRELARCVELRRAMMQAGLRPEEVDEDVFAVYLYAPDMPDPDLVIRTSGELRMSNFLLWQLAYSEFFFVDTLWPDFGEEDLRQAVAAYAGRQRRFGRR